MGFRVLRPVGLDYLRLVTDLLQRRRLADPLGGIWEAADLQWWWRADQHQETHNQQFWLDGDVPVAGVIFTRWNDQRFACDVIADASFAPAWNFVESRCAELGGRSIEMALADGADASIAAAERAGFRATDEECVVAWLEASADRPMAPRLPANYAVHSRRGLTDREHPMVRRSGPLVASLLGQCSLYDEDLDLAVYTGDGLAAGYALFWADNRTGVGLIEPMRVERDYQREWLATHLLRAGLDRLETRGCARFTVSYDPANPGARRLYLGAGFTPTTTTRTFRWQPIYAALGGAGGGAPRAGPSAGSAGCWRMST